MKIQITIFIICSILLLTACYRESISNNTIIKSIEYDQEPILNNTTIECRGCLMYPPSAPGWCKDGKIISPTRNACGCLSHPICIRN